MEQKDKIREQFIGLLAFEGWSQQALEKAVKNCGFEQSYADIIYPGKIAEFTNEFIEECNSQALRTALNDDFKKLRTTQKVEEIIFQRINAYHSKLVTIDNVRKFTGYCTNPAHLARSFRNIYEFSSDVWYLLGDKSTDFSYYTKRASLSAIYTKSMLYSLSDKSDNLSQTRKFIQKSIDGLMKINKLKQKIGDIVNYPKLRTKRK